MGLKSKETVRNADGSRTEKLRYGDGSGRDTTYKLGGFGNRVVSSTKRYPAK